MKEKPNKPISILSTEEKLESALHALSLQTEVMHKRAKELLLVNEERVFEKNEKKDRANELLIANRELAFQNEEKHKRAEELLIANRELSLLNSEQQAFFASIVNSSEEAMFSKTLDGIITSCNRAAETIFGYRPDEVLGKHIFILIPEYLQYEELELTKKIRNGETIQHFKTERIKKDGTVFNASLTITPIRDSKGAIKGASKILRDITSNVIAEEKLVKSNRMYAFISALNQMIMKTTDETTLFGKSCSIAVAIGNFKMAWIGLIDESTKFVTPLGHAGEEDDYLNTMVPISIEDVPEGRGPTGKALREDRYIFCNDIANHPDMMPWKKAAGERGYLSSIAFPLRKFGKVVGAFTLYAPVKDFFDDSEIALLEEAAADISHAMENLEKAALHEEGQNKIIESEEIFRRLFDESADATLLLDDSGFTRCNKSAVSILGYTVKEEILGRQLWDISPEKQPDEKLSKRSIKAMMLRALKDGYHFFEWILLKTDGSELPVEVMLTPIVLKGRQSFYTLIRDISKRKNALEKTRLLTKRLQLATTSAGMGIWDWDVINNDLVWDKGMYSLYNMDKKELNSIYEGWTSRIHPKDLDRTNEDIQNAIAGIKDYNTDFRIILNDGSVRYLKASGIVEKDAQGKALQMIGVNWDITELKEKEKEIRNSEVFNRSVINSLSAHLAVVDEKGEIISVNDAWSKYGEMNGKTSMERTGIGSNYFMVCENASAKGDKIAKQVLQGMKDVMNKKRKDFYLEYPCNLPTEQTRFGLRITKFESNEPLILLVHSNLKERLLAEIERQKITDDLVHRNHDLEQFTYIISHNLRSPVANLKGLLMLQGNESLSMEEKDTVAKGLISSVDNLDTVIGDLNTILKLKNMIRKVKERVVFADLVYGIEKSIHAIVTTENVKIIGQFDELAEMFTLKSYLYSIFYNLIANSIKYRRDSVQPIIEIKSLLGKDTIKLIFKDNGRGIDLKNNGDQMFGLYKRFHYDVEGKGMGLFMVKTQVEALGGKISVKSEVNKGTEFKIIFAKEEKNDN